MNTAEPRKDAAMCFQLTKTISLQSIDKIWVALFKMLGSQFDQMTLMIREILIEISSDNKGCKQIVLKLKPFDAQLFYGRLTETAKEYAFQ